MNTASAIPNKTSYSGTELHPVVVTPVFNRWDNSLMTRVLGFLCGHNPVHAHGQSPAGKPLLHRLPGSLRGPLAGRYRFRFSLDDRNNIMTLDPLQPFYRPLLTSPIHEPHVFGLLRLLAPHIRLFFDIGSGLGIHAWHLACMSAFTGQIHAYEQDPQLRSANLRGVQELAADRTISVQAPSSDPSFLAQAGVPDLVRIDLTQDVTRLPAGAAEMITAARPLLIVKLPEEPDRILEVEQWSALRRYEIFDIESSLDGSGEWPKTLTLRLLRVNGGLYSNQSVFVMPSERIEAILALIAKPARPLAAMRRSITPLEATGDRDLARLSG